MVNMSAYFRNANKLVNREYPWTNLGSAESYIEKQVKCIQNAVHDMEVFEKEHLLQTIRMRKWYIGAVDVMWKE